MGSLITATAAVAVIFFFLLPSLAHSGAVASEFVRPNLIGSYFQFINQSGTFLSSPSSDFDAKIITAKPKLKGFYLAVVHSKSNTILWSANRDSPISDSGQVSRTADGIVIANDSGSSVWQTQPLGSPVALLQLQDSGNLVLLDRSNNSLWQSFEQPTDTIVVG